MHFFCFQSSSSSSQHDALVKPTIYEHNFGFGTTEISPLSIADESQFAQHFQSPTQIEVELQPEQPDQSDVPTQILPSLRTLLGLIDVFFVRQDKIESDIHSIKVDVSSIKRVVLPSTSLVPTSNPPPP